MTDRLTAPHRPLQRRSLTVRGVVQGVGFRPFIARLAAELGVRGLVGNDATSVFIEAEAAPHLLDELERRIRTDAPPLAHITAVHSEVIAARGDDDFTIVSSTGATGQRTLVSPDVATCDDCLAELTNPTDRRYRHPFITCTNCGPRFTIINDLPYDRAATTMRSFTMCMACAGEYADPLDRRYHAQPIGCHDCGPALWLEDATGRCADRNEALELAVEALKAGQIVAIKGIGGFHLACDATNEPAVARLRERKRRPAKPFAIMARDLLAAASVVRLDAVAADVITQPARPIVLLPARAESPLAWSVAPGLDEVGVMLPYAPVHHLLMAEIPLLVMTSGNLSDEPLCFDNGEARDRLANIADRFLMQDRDIAVPCEDSVVAIVDGQEQPVRRSRGFAPLPVDLPEDGPAVLSVGAELKNTFTLTRGSLAFVSAHLGDMSSLQSRHALETSVNQLCALHGVRPEVVAVDEHPGYLSTSWGQQRADDLGVPCLPVQHHHAHFASLLAEHGELDTPAIGITFDGTGYACDRTVWGGELLESDGDIASVQRIGHLEQFSLVGGDAAVRHPWRVAMVLLALAEIDDATHLRFTRDVSSAERNLVASQLSSGTAVVRTSSAGRLFDGVAALLGVCLDVQYEAQAAMRLEAVARGAHMAEPLRIDVDGDTLRLGPMIRTIVTALRDGVEVPALALGFHHALADAAAHLAISRATERGIGVVGLTGGVMQNRLLAERLGSTLRDAGLRVLTHRTVPPNDGGLSLGQAAVARARYIHELSGRERGERQCV